MDIDYTILDPGKIYGGVTVLEKPKIQHALVDIPILSSVQITAVTIELNGFETVIRKSSLSKPRHTSHKGC